MPRPKTPLEQAQRLLRSAYQTMDQEEDLVELGRFLGQAEAAYAELLLRTQGIKAKARAKERAPNG